MSFRWHFGGLPEPQKRLLSQDLVPTVEAQLQHLTNDFAVDSYFHMVAPTSNLLSTTISFLAGPTYGLKQVDVNTAAVQRILGKPFPVILGWAQEQMDELPQLRKSPDIYVA